MRLYGLFLIFYFSGALAAVENKIDIDDIASSPTVTSIDIPVRESPDSELGLLEQLRLKVHSTEESLQHIWDRVQVCEGCHAYYPGKRNAYVPVLQGQNLEYLYSKLLMFQNNRRSYHPLGKYLDSLSTHDLMDISFFYARQSSSLQQILAFRDLQYMDEKGTVVSIRNCVSCHGVDGNGDQLIPAISGQNKNYLSYRIREIADNNSKVHLASDAPVSCEIQNVDVRSSRQMADLLSVVLDKQRAQLGAETYRVKCAGCHAVGDRVKTAPELLVNWSRHLLHGTEQLIYNLKVGNQHKFIHDRHLSFSQNELKDAIHYMIGQLHSSL